MINRDNTFIDLSETLNDNKNIKKDCFCNEFIKDLMNICLPITCIFGLLFSCIFLFSKILK